MVKLKSQFEGAVSEFFEKHAPSDLRDPIKKAKKNQIISDLKKISNPESPNAKK